MLTEDGIFKDLAPDLSIEERKVLLATQGPTQERRLGARSQQLPGEANRHGLLLPRMTA